MQIGKCRLCLEEKELQDSHIIPNAIFKSLFRKNHGRGITFADNDESYVEYSSKSWSENLLCSECETYLNKEYEQYSLSALRNSLRSVKVSKHGSGISFHNLDLLRFNLFFASIAWRAAVSSLSVYSEVIFPAGLEGEVRRSILNKKKVRSWVLGIRISRLIDKNPDGFSMTGLKEFIVSPFCRERQKGFSFCFLAEGFFIEIFFPGIRLKNRKSHGVINPNKKILFSPFLHIFDVPELIRVLGRCRVPCDHRHIPERSYALYQAREILQDMLNDSKKKV